MLGGDGAVNEAVNGIMASGPAEQRPLLAVIPGGGANVFARALGLPADPAAAIGRIREVIATAGYRTIGLGLAGDRYFTFSAGPGPGRRGRCARSSGCAPAGTTGEPALFAWTICASRPAPTGEARPDAGTRRAAVQSRTCS